MGEIKCAKEGKCGQPSDSSQLIFSQVKFFKGDILDVFDALDVVFVEREHAKILVLFDVFDSLNAVLVKEELTEVRVLVYVTDLADLVIRQVNPFERSWWIKVKHLCQLVT